MYGHSFADPDGHIWDVMWMDVAVMTAGQDLSATALAHPRGPHDRASDSANDNAVPQPYR